MSNNYYVRIKRKRDTYFVYCKPTDSILKLKHHMSALVKTKEPKQIRLLLPKSTAATPQTANSGAGAVPHQTHANHPNQNSKEKDGAASGKDHSLYTAPDIQATLISLGIQNDGLLYMVFLNDEGGHEKFEEVGVPDYEPLLDLPKDQQ